MSDNAYVEANGLTAHVDHQDSAGVRPEVNPGGKCNMNNCAMHE